MEGTDGFCMVCVCATFGGHDRGELEQSSKGGGLFRISVWDKYGEELPEGSQVVESLACAFPLS